MRSNEFIHDAPSTPGEQVHVNHEGCRAGVDTKKRLYIKRTHDGTVVAYCHHCGESGVSRSKYRHISSYSTPKPTSVSHTRDIRLPVDVLKNTSMWPKAAIGWLLKYGISFKEITDYGITFSPRYNRICFPLYMDGVYIGWQGRSLDPDADPPKYLTMVDPKNPNGNVACYIKGGTSDKCVLVEDCVSAIKVCRQVSTVSLLGSHLKDDSIVWIANRWDDVAIWLDNDKPEVLKEQQRLHRLFGMLGKSRLILTPNDPKCYTDMEIREWLK